MEETVTTVPGLRYRAGYLTQGEQDQLLRAIDQQPWITDLKRRVQHYGYRYNYTHRSIDQEMYLGPLPDWAHMLAERLQRDGFVGCVPDQLIVNEYLPGQGISGHVDCVPCFGDTILSLSLASSCVMMFTRVRSTEKVEMLLAPGSLVVMQGESRYNWKHSIPLRKTDVYQGLTIPRSRRVSLTLRNIIVEQAKP